MREFSEGPDLLHGQDGPGLKVLTERDALDLTMAPLARKKSARAGLKPVVFVFYRRSSA